MTASILLPQSNEIGVDERDLFSAVYNEKLRDEIALKSREAESDPARKYGRQDHPTDPIGRVYAQEFMQAALKDWIECVPDAKLKELVNAIRYAAMPLADDWADGADTPEIIQKRREAMDRARTRLRERRAYLASSQYQNIMLTDTASSAKVEPVKSQLDNLLGGLDRLIKEPGKKTDLAGFLGAPLASVSRWLSGKREPGREITLKMLRWVEQQERQQNTLGSAINTTKGKTLVRKSDNEKQNQVS